jgi:RNA ligase
MSDPARTWQPTKDRVDALVAEKLISARSGHVPGVFILNYTHKTQFDRVWTTETRACRGMIVRERGDGTYDVLHRPFPKFFNLGEPNAAEPPAEPFEVYEKMDGALGIVYERMDGPAIATRGSFGSAQAIDATALLRERWPDWRPDPSVTYLVEIIHPHHRIVVDYGGRRDLVLLGAIETATGRDLPLDDVAAPFEKVRRYDGIADVDELLRDQESNREGYVVYWPSQQLRLKVKFSEYVRIHRLVTGVTERRIWEMLRDGMHWGRIMSGCPPMYQRWVESAGQALLDQHDGHIAAARRAVDSIPAFESRREQAEWIMARRGEINTSIAFAILDGRDEAGLSSIAWKLCRPEASRPFVVEE